MRLFCPFLIIRGGSRRDYKTSSRKQSGVPEFSDHGCLYGSKYFFVGVSGYFQLHAFFFVFLFLGRKKSPVCLLKAILLCPRFQSFDAE